MERSELNAIKYALKVLTRVQTREDKRHIQDRDLILLRKTLKNRLIILSIFTPIFILYPVAEIEALGRKEILIFLIIVIYFLIDVRKFKNQLLFKLIIFPILILIWEPAIFEKFKVSAKKKSNINRSSLKWEKQLNN